METHEEQPDTRPVGDAVGLDPTAIALGRILRLEALAAAAVLAIFVGIGWLTGLDRTVERWIARSPLSKGELTIIALIVLALGALIAHRRARLAISFLEASRDRLDTMPLPAFIWHRKGENWLFAGGNAAAVETTRGRLHSLVGLRLHDIYADQPGVIALLERCAQHELPISEEMDFTFATTGETKHMEVHCSFAPPDSIIVVTRDLTAQYEAEQHLLLEKRRFEAVVEHSPDSVAIIDELGTIMYISPAVTRIFGYNPAELQAEMRFDLIHPDDREVATTNMARAAEQPGEPVTYRHRVQHADGSYRWIESVATSHLDDPDIGGIVFHIRDITETYTNQIARDDALRELEILHDTLPIGIAVVDRFGNHKKVNKRFAEMFGTTKERLWETPGRVLADLVQAQIESPLERTAALDALTEANGIPSIEAVIQPLDGSDPRRLVTTIVPFPQSSEQEDLSIAVVLDVTDQRFMEERIRRSERLEVIGRFSGGIAHDFNNLLLVIRNYLALVSEKIADDPDASADAEQADQAAMRAGELVRQLLSFTRHEAPSGSTDLNATVREMAQMFKRIIGEDIALETDLREEPWLTSLERSEAEQILMNLVINARDAMPGGGRLLVTAKNEPVTGTRAYKVDPGEYVRLTVSDTGVGISSEVRDKIFDPFFTTKGGSGGTGLGLSTVYGIVYNAGGFITVESAPDRGTTISAYLPRQTEGSPVTEDQEDIAPTQTAASILVVEDDPQVLTLVHRILEKAGYTVQTATCGTEALEISDRTEGSIDLLLSDVVMPGMGGPDLAAALRERGKIKDVVLMSGYLDRFEQGIIEDILMKPFTMNQLLHKIEERLVGSAR